MTSRFFGFGDGVLNMASLLRIERLDPVAIDLTHNMTPHLERGSHLPVLGPERLVSDDEAADALAPFFPDLVVDCCRHHVAAKRYLCAREQGYFDTLSEASVHSLNLQGGPMGDEEAAAFEAHPHFTAIIAVRRYDEAGKDPDLEVAPFASYLPMLERMVAMAG